MTLELRPFDSLGAANFGWLDAKHHFSFGHYYDPKRMHVGPLRVWNDDTIAPGTGFDPHPHRDMEIIKGTAPTNHETVIGIKNNDWCSGGRAILV